MDDGAARETLKKVLRHKSLFKNEICARYPPTIQDAMHRAKGLNLRRKTSESSVIWLERGRKWQKLVTSERKHLDMNAHAQHDERSIEKSELQGVITSVRFHHRNMRSARQN